MKINYTYKNYVPEVGDKVRVKSKSTGRSVDESQVWKRAKGKKQDFLYVAKIRESGRISLSADPGSQTGDRFTIDDILPYV